MAKNSLVRVLTPQETHPKRFYIHVAYIYIGDVSGK